MSNVRERMRRSEPANAIPSDLPPPDEVNDLDDVVFGEAVPRVFGPRDEVPVALHGYRSFRQPEMLDQSENRQSIGDLLPLAVHR